VEEKIKALIYRITELQRMAEEDSRDPVMHHFNSGKVKAFEIVIQMLEELKS